ncbi:lysophospholipase [Rhodoligotrophos appendicifer]|uniref:alpha/beta fold hydrolase n=1 Tax=Rhodoligotrophos appendicifer TaxID=987056 RepID=UPI0011867C38|nr:alpha/beta hydrolase [Rhodoligotrophos appendicifer]
MDPISLTLNRPPAGLTLDYFVTPSGARLRYGVCGAKEKPNRGTVCLFQGRGEFLEKYYETIRDLRQRHFAVAAVDWRGQGGSSRLLKNSRKGHVRSFAQYDEDLTSFMREVVLPDCPPPYFGLAHSTGGNILLRALARRSWFQKVVVCAPLIGIKAPGVPERLARTLIRLACAIGLGRCYVPGTGDRMLDRAGLANSVLTSDPERFDRMIELAQNCPDLTVGGPTLRWLKASLDSMAVLERDLPGHHKFQCPVLMVLAGADQVSDNIAARRFARAMRSVAVVEIPGARHELLMEQDFYREQFWAAFDSFVFDDKRWRYDDAA